jgi:hypothetical protein
MIGKRLMVVALAVLAMGPAVSAELGRVDLNGRQIIVDDNGTWSYAPPEPAAPVNTPQLPPPPPGTVADAATCAVPPQRATRLAASFCFDPAEWNPGTPQGAQEFAYFSADGLSAAAVVTETVFLNATALQQAIVTSTANGAGVTPEQVTVEDTGTHEVNGKTWSSVVFTLPFSGTNVTFRNYFISEQGVGTMQVVFWSEPKDAASTAAKAETVLNTLTFGS